MQTRWLELTGVNLPVLRVVGDPWFDFAARRWTTEDLDRARKPTKLPPSAHVWLNVDYGQQGLGGASCGPPLPERYRLPVRAYRFTVTFLPISPAA